MESNHCRWNTQITSVVGSAAGRPATAVTQCQSSCSEAGEVTFHTIWPSVKRQTASLKDTITIEQVRLSSPEGIKGFSQSIIHSHTRELPATVWQKVTQVTSERFHFLWAGDTSGSLVSWLNYNQQCISSPAPELPPVDVILMQTDTKLQGTTLQ